MCVVAAETPAGPLAPFERRVVAHVALRAGARGEVPAPALSDGFDGGETDFMKAFREEVDADARQRGLTRPRLSGRRIGLLCALLLIPAGALAIAVTVAHRHHALAYAGLSFLAGCWVTGGIGISRRRSAAGQEALDRWRSAVAGAPGGGASRAASGRGASRAASDGGGRLLAYAAALGAAPGAVAVFAQGGTKVAWSSYRGGWQQIEIETNTWPWPRALLVMAAVIVGPVLYFWAAIWLGTHGMGAQAGELVGLTVAAVIAGVLVRVAGRALFPRIAEFDGQVIRQWMVKGDDSPDEYHVAIDDGTSAKAWDFTIGSEPYRLLTPGTFVHARVNLRNRAEQTVEPVEPPAVARPLAAVAAEQQRAADGGLPDPAALVTADQAAAILGGPVQGNHLSSPVGRAMTWQRTGKAEPVLRIDVREAARPPGIRTPARTGWPVPGVADGYLLGDARPAGVALVEGGIDVAGRRQLNQRREERQQAEALRRSPEAEPDQPARPHHPAGFPQRVLAAGDVEQPRPRAHSRPVEQGIIGAPRIGLDQIRPVHGALAPGLACLDPIHQPRLPGNCLIPSRARTHPGSFVAVTYITRVAEGRLGR